MICSSQCAAHPYEVKSRDGQRSHTYYVGGTLQKCNVLVGDDGCNVYSMYEGGLNTLYRAKA